MGIGAMPYSGMCTAARASATPSWEAMGPVQGPPS